MKRLLALLLFALALTPAAAAAYPLPGYVTGDVFVRDPSFLVRPDGNGRNVFGTHDRMLHSGDRVAFRNVGAALTSRPAWWTEYNAGKDVWAPDVSFHNGKYWMYYSVSSFGSQKSAIGLATSSSGQPGSFVDQGKVITSVAGSQYNAIDPSLLVEPNGGAWRLSFGSFWGGIYQIRIDPATGKRHSVYTNRPHLASGPSSQVEAPHIYYRAPYYYLFVSWGTCCDGWNSTYQIRVGRSTYSYGGFVDRNGVPMTSGGGTMVLESHNWVKAPGGQSVVTDWDHPLLVYHYYDTRYSVDNEAAKLGINFLGWDSAGWPYVW